MMDDNTDNSDNEPSPQGPLEPNEPFVQQFQQSPVAARLTDDVAAGSFCTGALVMRGKDEFMIDFIQAVRRPPRVAARVVLSHRVMGEFVEACKKNLTKYEEQFGPPKTPPKPERQEQPSIEKIYEDMKLPDEMLPGRYANVAMVGHAHGEFLMDFITQFFPKAAVSSRVYISASNMPGLVRTLSTAFTHQPKLPPPPKPPEDDGMYT
jgi:hypothetical protein